MFGKLKSKHDLKDEEYQTEDDIMSTELSDVEANELYRRYKLATYEVKESREALEEKEEDDHADATNRKRSRRSFLR